VGRVALMPEVKDGLKRAEREERKSDTLMNCLSRGGRGWERNGYARKDG
jgi:hypothetical protein